MGTEQHFHGVVRGRTVELSDDPGIQSGIEVEVILRPSTAAPRAVDVPVQNDDEVAAFWTDEDDRILAGIQAARERVGLRKLPHSLAS